MKLGTRPGRDQAVAEAIARVFDGEAKFPGWDPDPKVLQSIFEASLTAHSGLQLLPALSDLQIQWLPHGHASTRAWTGRWRRRLMSGVRLRDPLVIEERISVG